MALMGIAFGLIWAYAVFSEDLLHIAIFFFSSRRRHTRWPRDWSSEVCSSDLRLIYSRPAPDLLRAARFAQVRTLAVTEGSEIDSGSLHLEVEWPSQGALEGAAGDPNETAIVMLARWRSFSMLLTADAEAEAVPMDPGPIDVLKVAHHGSEDAGLDALLDRTVPRLAVISVGADNPYGHPTADILSTLAHHGIATLRTDQEGDVEIDVTGAGWPVE